MIGVGGRMGCVTIRISAAIRKGGYGSAAIQNGMRRIDVGGRIDRVWIRKKERWV